MNKTNNQKKGGLIKWIIIIIALIALASFFFDFSVQEVVEDEQTQSNFRYIWENLSGLYKTYLSNIVNYLWNDIFIDLLWSSFTENMENIKAGEPTSLETLMSTIEVSQ